MELCQVVEQLPISASPSLPRRDDFRILNSSLFRNRALDLDAAALGRPAAVERDRRLVDDPDNLNPGHLEPLDAAVPALCHTQGRGGTHSLIWKRARALATAMPWRDRGPHLSDAADLDLYWIDTQRERLLPNGLGCHLCSKCRPLPCIPLTDRAARGPSQRAPCGRVHCQQVGGGTIPGPRSRIRIDAHPSCL